MGSCPNFHTPKLKLTGNRAHIERLTLLESPCTVTQLASLNSLKYTISIKYD